MLNTPITAKHLFLAAALGWAVALTLTVWTDHTLLEKVSTYLSYLSQGVRQ